MNKLSPVFLDLDGVIVDWLNGMRKWAGKPPEIYDGFRSDPLTLCHEAVDELFDGRENLSKIQLERPAEFWLNLEFFPWADYLVRTMQSNFEVCFLTNPGPNPNAAYAKLEWQMKHYPDIPIMIGKHKYHCAGPNKALIDDDEWQLSKFKAAGGKIIKWPNQFLLEKESLDKVKHRIDNIVEELKAYEQQLPGPE